MAFDHLALDCLNLFVTPLFLAFLPVILPLLIIYRLMFSTLACFFSKNMSGRAVLITGASSGIREHVAYEYAEKRASLVIVARRKNQLLEVAARAHELGSPDVLVYPFGWLGTSLSQKQGIKDLLEYQDTFPIKSIIIL